VTLEDLDGSGYTLDLGVRGKDIVLRRSDPLVRRRFTLAHEIGHLALSDHGIWIDNHDSLIETWCDEFAANLLVPGDALRESMKAVGDRELIPRLLRLTTSFGVSQATLLTRAARAFNWGIALLAVSNSGVVRVIDRYRPYGFNDRLLIKVASDPANRLFERAHNGVAKAGLRLISHQTSRRNETRNFIVVGLAPERPGSVVGRPSPKLAAEA
jgi:hypothetical protein